MKFCSGPTPMYAPPGAPSFDSDEATCRYEVSLEMALSEMKGPSGSESAPTVSEKAEAGGAGACTLDAGAEASMGAGTDPSGDREEGALVTALADEAGSPGGVAA